jgi:hypothetical protein
VTPFIVAGAAGQIGRPIYSDPRGSLVVYAKVGTVDSVQGSPNYTFNLNGAARVELSARGVILQADHLDGLAARRVDQTYALVQGNARKSVDFISDSREAARFNKSPMRPDRLSDRFEVTSDSAALSTWRVRPGSPKLEVTLDPTPRTREALLQSIDLPHAFKAVDHRTGLTTDPVHTPYVEDMTVTASSGKFFFIPAEGTTPAKLQTGLFERPVHIHLVKTLDLPEKPPVVTDYDVTGNRMTFDFTKSVGEVVISGNVHYRVDGGNGGMGDADKVTINTDEELKLTGIHIERNLGATR